MNQNILLTIIEIFIGLIIEGVIISMVFTYIANKTSEKQNAHLEKEMAKIELQSKFQFEQMLNSSENAKNEIISQIKESAYEKSQGGNQK
jgi:cell division protein FtsB